MYKKLSCCKHCQISFQQLNASERANHSRWCVSNPLRLDYAKNNHGAQLNTSQSVAKRTQGIKKAHADGKYNGAAKKGVETKKKNGTLNHTIETIEVLRKKALASPHRRLVRSIREYVKKDGSIVKLDSSWEEELANRLDHINVEWTRPPPLKWIDKYGVQRNYFPDFYLPAYNAFLDPKSPYVIKAQIDKIECLTEQVKNLIILKSLDECRNFSINILPAVTHGEQ
jgi:hypothetical protein